MDIKVANQQKTKMVKLYTKPKMYLRYISSMLHTFEEFPGVCYVLF